MVYTQVISYYAYTNKVLFHEVGLVRPVYVFLDSYLRLDMYFFHIHESNMEDSSNQEKENKSHQSSLCIFVLLLQLVITK